MNRRNFIGNLLAAAAGFSILPGAGRLWQARRRIVEPVGTIGIRIGDELLMDGDVYNCVMIDPPNLIFYPPPPETMYIIENFSLNS